MNSHDKHFRNRSARAQQRAKNLLAREDFQNDIQVLRKKKLGKQELINEIAGVAHKYKLGPSWLLGLSMYVEKEDPVWLIRQHKLDIDIRVNEKTGFQELWVRIDADTTLEDIKDRWNLIKYNQKYLDYAGSEKFQPIDEKVAERDALAYRLKQEGLKLAEVAEKVSEQFPRLDGEDYWWSDVSKMIERHKKRLDIN